MPWWIRRRRFQHEAQAAARLDHANIVPVYDASEAGPVCFIASAFCPGVTLAAWLQRAPSPFPCGWRRHRGRSRTASSTRTAAACCTGTSNRATSFCKRTMAQGRTLTTPKKPSLRIHLSAPHPLPFVPKITDFGLAKLLTAEAGGAVSAGLTRNGAILGTARYMAPEQAEGKTNQIGTAADVYALGAMLYELLTGRPVFEAQSELAVLQQVRFEEPIAPRGSDRTCRATLRRFV